MCNSYLFSKFIQFYILEREKKKRERKRIPLIERVTAQMAITAKIGLDLNQTFRTICRSPTRMVWMEMDKEFGSSLLHASHVSRKLKRSTWDSDWHTGIRWRIPRGTLTISHLFFLNFTQLSMLLLCYLKVRETEKQTEIVCHIKIGSTEPGGSQELGLEFGSLRQKAWTQNLEPVAVCPSVCQWEAGIQSGAGMCCRHSVTRSWSQEASSLLCQIITPIYF